MEKLQIILENEFLTKRSEMINYDKSKKKLHIKLEDVKNDEDVIEVLNQLKRNIAYNAMRMIDEEWYEVKQLNKKRKTQCDEDIKTCTQPILCTCSKELPIEINKNVE